MRSHPRYENAKTIADLKPGAPYEPFSPEEFLSMDALQYSALPQIPCKVDGWRMIECMPLAVKETDEKEVDWATVANQLTEAFKLAEGLGQTIGVMRHRRQEYTIWAKYTGRRSS